MVRFPYSLEVIMTPKTKKIVIISAISVFVLLAAILFSIFAIPVTVTLDYVYYASDSYWNRPIAGDEQIHIGRYEYVNVFRNTYYCPPFIYRSGYDFKGWYKDSACTVSWVNGVDKVRRKTTLYAKWEERKD